MQNELNSTLNEAKTVRSKQGIWHTYDATDGLSGGVRCLMQDRHSHLWLGTGLGLCRYDGAEFIIYTAVDGLANKQIGCICEDSRGRIWFGVGMWMTELGWGATCFDGEDFVTYTTEDGLVDNHVLSICEDHQGRLWFATGNGISCFDGERFTTYTTEDGLADNRVLSICEDHQKRLWFGTNGGGTTCFDGDGFVTYTTEDGLANNHVRAICEDGQKRLWFGTDGGGTTCFDGERFTTYTAEDGLAGNHVLSIYGDGQGRVWLSAWGGGISCFHRQHFVNYSVRDGLPGNTVNDILQDREGFLWFADGLAGLTRFDPQTMHLLTEEPTTEVLIQDRQDRLWFGNDRSLYCLSGEQQRCRTFGGRIYSLLEDSNGAFWVGTGGDGLYCFPSTDAVWGGVPRHFTEGDGLCSNRVLSLLETRDGTIWAGTASPGGLCRFNGLTFDVIPTPQPLISQLYEDSHGCIWMGGWAGGGLSCYEDGQLVTYTKADGLPNDGAKSIVEEAPGKLWIGTKRGLCCVRTQDEKHPIFTEVSEFTNTQHQCAAKDTRGQLWFGTLMGGVYRYDGKSLTKRDSDSSGHFQILTMTDGLPSNSITGLVPQSDGTMIIGTYRGIVHYQPTAILPPRIEIREAIADKVYRNPTAVEITPIGPDGHVPLLTISYYSLSFATRQTRYSYILEGYDCQWRQTWENAVRYERLPPGEYTFKVIAVNRDVVPSETPAVLPLHILPNPWTQLQTKYETEIGRMQKLLELTHQANSQTTLSGTARVIVDGLRSLGFDRAGVWMRDVGDRSVRGLWGTDPDGNIYENASVPYPEIGMPTTHGYDLEIDPRILKEKLGVDKSQVFLFKGQDEGIFESIWGYPPPCPGYYRRDERGDNIALCVTSEDERIGIIAVDNYITRRWIDETSANLFSLVRSTMAKALVNVALRESLMQSESKNRALLEAIPDLMFHIHRDGTFLDFKAAKAIDLEMPPNEFLGRTVHEVFSQERAQEAMHYVERTLQTGEMQSFTYELSVNNQKRHYEARYVVSGENSVLAIVRDITERERAESQLNARVQEQAVVAQLGQRALSGLDLPELMDEATAVVAQTLGVEYCKILELLPDGNALRLRAGVGWREGLVGSATVSAKLDSQAGFTLLYHSPVIVTDLQMETRFSGPPLLIEHRVVSGMSVIIHGHGRPFGVLGAHTTERRSFMRNDVHFLQSVANVLAEAIERKRSEEALRKSNRQLAKTLTKLRDTQQRIIQQERLRALGKMASGIAHDFNNHLAPILGFSDLLLSQPESLDDGEKTTRYLQMINTAAADAATVVRRLREFYRSRETSESFREVDLNRLVESAILLTQPKWKDQAQANGVTIQMKTDLGDVSPIAGVEAELREVLTNLIFNAVDAMKADGSIVVRTFSNAQHVFLQVSDTGVGMTEDIRQRCLDPFFSTKGELGTGLGLSMAFGIIQRHDGDIDIESEPGRGTTFSIRLPIQTQKSMQMETFDPQVNPARRIRVLVVEDETPVRQMVTAFLSVDGHAAITATNGREALEKFHAEPFDLVVLDRAMPEMNGDQLATLIKQASPNTPIIMLTGFGEIMQSTGDHPTGVDMILSKPIRLDTFQEALITVMGE